MNEIKLTDSEKDLMEILWEKEKAFMKEILDIYPEPKPATTTVATLLKRMQNKDLVGYTLYGNSREYYPKVAKGEYFKEEMTSMIDRFFNSSVTQFASFFTKNAELSQSQLKELREIIDKQIDE
ncbi:BlaI/MecI/CopY family transcriptional regulator [Chryseobacterium sp. ERMR1:04]|uniref:BlaI/MecI/CopY family transcriptional regulator n=1 Tax=Chryseobacterium sp. ERMR1:04 TaxID=1705393 RepID=UPI0006C877F8|nr:BlaI/MecI/CopY family transcriptional regulator [Chryseobacterium sp. ERMR1:04]KPH11937.1 penicillinase repressor [Chryseobacterium sp. ERMR1:04]